MLQNSDCKMLFNNIYLIFKLSACQLISCSITSIAYDRNWILSCKCRYLYVLSCFVSRTYTA
jgi:hypothetical protein